MKRLCMLKAALLAALSSGAQAPFDLDTTFRCVVLARNVNSVVPLADGRVVISGRLQFPFLAGERNMARLFSDGTRDQSFYSGGLGGGKITPYNTGYYVGTSYAVRRVLADGQEDPSFALGGTSIPYFSSGQGGDYYVYPDGRVLLTGVHDLYDSTRGFVGFYNLIWFTNTGYLDTMQHHRYCDGSIDVITVQPDGKFLCSGVLGTYEGQSVGRIFRVEADGALDPSFSTNYVWGNASRMSVLADGRIIATGYLLADGSSDTLQVVRLLPDGSLDPTFNNTLSAPLDVFGAFGYMGHTILPDGRIVLHGNYYSVDGEPRSGIALLDSNGYLLNDALAGDGCGVYNDGFYPVHATFGSVPGQSGTWYIYGGYIGYDDGSTNDPEQRFMSRLYGLDVGVEEPQQEQAQMLVYPNPATQLVQVELYVQNPKGELELHDALGRTVQHHPVRTQRITVDVAGLAAGCYLVVYRHGAALLGKSRLLVE